MKCALIGTGMVADTHVAALRDAPGLSLAGVMGRDPARTMAFATRHADLPIYPDLAAVCASDADFAILATPPDARSEIVSALIAAGKPILMEKPIERSLVAATALVEACEAANLQLGIVLQHRTREVSRVLKNAIGTGALGAIAHVDIRVPWWREQSYYDVPGRGTYSRDGGGVMITQAIHTLDLALWCLGPVTSLQAMMHRTPLHDLEAEDWAAALLHFASGARGTLMATTAAYPDMPETLTIQGSRASATLAAGVLQIHHLDGRSETFGATQTSGGGADPMAFTHAWHQAVIEDFADSLSANRVPLASGRDALSAHAVIAAMQEASRTGQLTEVIRT